MPPKQRIQVILKIWHQKINPSFHEKDGHKRKFPPRDARERLRRENLCYKCKGNWEHGHVCKQVELQRKDLFFKCKEKWKLGHIYGKRSQVCNIEALANKEAWDEEKEKSSKRIKCDIEESPN